MMQDGSVPPVDLPTERRRIRIRGALAFVFCGIVLGLAAYWLPQWLSFPVVLADRLSFALRANLFILIWLLVAVGLVARIRRHSVEDNAGSAFSSPSARLAIPAAFLQNTLEQVLITALAFMALATVEGEAALAYIAGSIPVFAVGRVTFLRGYPHGAGARAFGMVSTALPSLGAFLWSAFEVVQLVLAATVRH